MKLITEEPLALTGFYEDELSEASGQTERNYYISGIFSTPEAKNRNGRMYSRNIWTREVEKYQYELANKTKNTLCEYNHPPRSSVDEMQAVARIVELSFDDKGNVIGKAKILNDNTEKTNKLKGLIKEGIKIGVSSRGVGKVSAAGIVEDFKLITYDVVPDPSDYNALLNGVVEGHIFENGIMTDKEFEIDENGCIGEACSINENEETGCPIQKKIDESRDTIYKNLDAYLQECFAKLEKDQDNIVESISEYLEKASIEINEEVEILENTIDEYTAKSIIEALSTSTEKSTKVVEEAIVEEEIVEANMDDELDSMVKMGKISKTDLDRVIEFAKICNPKSLEKDLDVAFGKKFDRSVLRRVYQKISQGK